VRHKQTGGFTVDEYQEMVDDSQGEFVNEGEHENQETLETQDEPEVSEEGDGEPEQPVRTFSQDEVDSIIERRLARERRVFEEAGIDRDSATQLAKIAQNYGVSPQNLMKHVLEQLGAGNQTNQEWRDPRVDQLLYEKEIQEVTENWEKDFGELPDRYDIESIEAIAEDEGVSLSKAYIIATRTTLKDKMEKQMEKRLMKNLEAKKKGKVQPGTSTKVTPKKQYGSIKDALNAAIEEQGIDL